MVRINWRVARESTFRYVVALVCCGVISPGYLKADVTESWNETDVGARLRNDSCLDTAVKPDQEREQAEQAVKDAKLANDGSVFFSLPNSNKLQQQFNQQPPNKQVYLNNGKSMKQGNAYGHRNIYTQQEKFVKDKMATEQEYRTTRIKESETAERNLKKLLRILNENLSFQFSGESQSRQGEQAKDKRKKPTPPEDEDYYDDPIMPRKEIQISSLKESVPISKNAIADTDALRIIEETLKKQYKKVLNSKISSALAKDTSDIVNNETLKLIEDWIKQQKSHKQLSPVVPALTNYS